MMEDFINYFGYSNGLTPDVYFKYIIFVSLFACVSRLVGEMINSVK